MTTTMLLAPNLATMTYACPHMIVPAAVVAAAQPIRKTGTPHMRTGMLARPVPIVEEEPTIFEHPRAPRPADLLVNKDNVWRSVPSITPEVRAPCQHEPTSHPRSLFEPWHTRTRTRSRTRTDQCHRVRSRNRSQYADAEVSDARLSQRKVGGGVEWTVESPITFEYNVREVADVLDPANDALVFGHISDAASLARAKARPLKRVVVVDEAVHAHYGERIEAYFEHFGVNTKLLVLPTTEENKDMDMVLTIAEAIHELGVDRRLDPVIAIGGGVCMDIVGFAASIYRRRTPYVRVPTTLMGYVDASVGAKTGVNFSGKKNKLGAYIPPALTLLDRTFLSTLPERQLANGAAEIAKMALVKDPELFDLLAQHGPELIAHKFQDAPGAPRDGSSPASRVLYLSIQTMLEELAPNLWEDSLERLVDFGHVFSMELEMDALFEEKLFHGEAVAIDMALSACLSHVRGHIDSATLDAILDMMRGLSLPVYDERMDAAMCDEALYERVKFSQGQKLPLPVGAGKARLFNDIAQQEVEAALEVWRERCGA